MFNLLTSVLILSATSVFGGAALATEANPPVVASADRRILFLCTGNYYRSRLAEAVFNYEAERAGLKWRATSRGLRTNLLSAKERRTRISHYTVEKLDELNIPRSFAWPDPRAVTRADLDASDCVIGLSEREHKPYLEADFAPTARLPLIYWTIEDVDRLPAREALGALTTKVRELVKDLKANRVPVACRAND